MLKFSLFFSVLFTLTISHSQVESKLSTTQKFDEVLHYVNMMYVDTVNDKKLTETAIEHC